MSQMIAVEVKIHAKAEVLNTSGLHKMKVTQVGRKEVGRPAWSSASACPLAPCRKEEKK